MKVAFASAAILFIACIANAGAQSIYKWIDENGVTHFSEQRPQGVESERLSVKVNSGFRGDSSGTADSSTESFARSREARQEKREQAAEDAERAAQQKAIREENCAKARERLNTYETSRRLYREREDGEREYLTDDELDQARADSRELVKEWCD